MPSGGAASLRLRPHLRGKPVYMISYFLFVALLWLAALAVTFGWVQGRLLRRLWREPMLRCPVLIFEFFVIAPT